jgi:hypothetical protein
MAELTSSELQSVVTQVQQFLDRRLISVQTQFEIQTIRCHEFWKSMPEPVPEGVVYNVPVTEAELTPTSGKVLSSAPVSSSPVRNISSKVVRREDGKELVLGVLEFETQWEFILLDTYISRVDNEGGENRLSNLGQFQNAMCFAPTNFLTMPSLSASFRGFINHPGKYLAPDYRPAESGVDVFGNPWQYEQSVLVLKVLNYAH